MRITNNLSALSAYNSLDLTNTSLQKVIHALSTGLRINSASDDAAGFAISEKIRSQIRGLDIALRNSQDGISLLQTAEGALGETNSMLSRMRELAVQASNDSLTSNDRQYIQLEIEQLKDQIDRIAETTQFNRKRLLDGSCGAVWTSSNLNVNLKIHGGLTITDEYGQKVSLEGNYRIDVRAEAGEAQVQKSNIIQIIESHETVQRTGRSIIGWEEKTYLEEKEREWSIIINGGNNGEAISSILEAPNIDEINSGWEFNSSSKTLTIKSSGTYRIAGKNAADVTQNRVVIEDGVEANIFLDNVNIDVSTISDACAFEIQPGAKANLYLSGNNTLKSGRNRAGLEVRDDLDDNGNSLKTAEVTITSADGDGSTNGKLYAWSAYRGAAIGGWAVKNGRAGTITINGGTIEAISVSGGASGIGSGETGPGAYDGGGTITINGGNIRAEGYESSAGIGTAFAAGFNELGRIGSDGTKITITGGTITARGANGAADIGGGNSSDSGQIRIDNSLKNSMNSMNIGKGIGGRIDDVQYLDLPKHTPDPVPDLPSAIVKTPSTILEPIYDDSDNSVSYEDIVTFSTLKETSQFYDSNGIFLISQPQTLTITQGDGQTASITLYETDTMYDVAEKINNVIAYTFGNSRHTDNPNKFCTIADGTKLTSESAYESEEMYDNNGNFTGHNIHTTMLIRSAKAGKAGELHFSGDEDLLNALGLNTIRESSETRYTASIYNAHSGKVIAKGVRTTGNILKGIIPNVDIEFDSMAGIKSTWDEATKRYILSDDETYSAFIHLTDNSATFQTGANQGEDFMIQLGSTSSKTLGISSVSVVTRETASQSISVIDSAIHQVSAQRAKIGAYQNALEHTMTNLTTTSTNLSSAESRIRDADMSKLMIEFVKLQILNRSGTSMLAQANQLPQSIMNLMQ